MKTIVRKRFKKKLIPLIIVICFLILFILFYLSGVKSGTEELFIMV